MSRKYLEDNYKHLEIIDINKKGLGVGKNSNGTVFFVKNVVPGDVVDVRVYKKRRNYFEAEPTNWIINSKKRVDPICEHFGVCGGCKWQHLDYKNQLNFKESGVIHNLKTIGKLQIEKILPIAGAEDIFFYRNKLEFSFSNRRWLTSNEIKEKKEIDRNGLGFHKSNMWNKVVDINHCYLQPNPSNDIRNCIREYALKIKLDFFDPVKKSGFLRTLMIKNTLKGEIMVLIQLFKENKEKRESLLEFIFLKFPQITSLLYCINSKPNDSIFDQEIICFRGTNYITEKIDKLYFRIGAKSFFQTNSKQAKILFNIIKDFAALKVTDLVYDLYTGTGTIALILAKYCTRIVGIDSISEAIESARKNAQLNKINNAKFELGDIKDCFNDEFIYKYGKADIVITDPPRSGMNSKVIHRLLELSPKKIVYVSCNSATQARDLEMMKSNYKIIKSQAVDMFPHTNHVENIVLLHNKIKDE